MIRRSDVARSMDVSWFRPHGPFHGMVSTDWDVHRPMGYTPHHIECDTHGRSFMLHGWDMIYHGTLHPIMLIWDVVHPLGSHKNHAMSRGTSSIHWVSYKPCDVPWDRLGVVVQTMGYPHGTLHPMPMGSRSSRGMSHGINNEMVGDGDE